MSDLFKCDGDLPVLRGWRSEYRAENLSRFLVQIPIF